jgi:predicted enzyme related to lactoylglutathione lyase
MTTGIRKAGDFCWINMITPSSEEARAFYAAVLGWGYVEMPGVGFRIQVGGLDVGAIYDTNSPMTPPGTQPQLAVMMKVDSADATAARITELGGKVKPAMDVFDAGRMVVCEDPNGAKFDIWEARKMPGSVGDRRAPGAPTWFETITSDDVRARAFYEALFGWTSDVVRVGSFDYTNLSLDGTPIGGMFPVQEVMGEVASHWGVYFAVADVDATTTLAAALDATVHISPTNIPNIGRFSGVVSPQGVMFYMITYPS